MGLLLEVEKDIVIPLVIFGVLCLVALFIFIGLKHVYGKDRGMQTKSEPKIINVELKDCFFSKREMQFLKDLNKILPDEFVAFPNVGVDCIVQPKGDKVLYNTILSQYIDVCIFLKNDMKPILAIDLVEPSKINEQLKPMHPNVIKALSMVNIPIIEYQLSEENNLTELRVKVIDAMPAKIVAMLKEKFK